LKKAVIALALVALLCGAEAAPASALVDPLRISACESGDALYRVSVFATDAGGPMHVHTEDVVNGHVCQGTVEGTATFVLEDIPAGSTVLAINTDNEIDNTSLVLEGSFPACSGGSTDGVKPLFKMWLLTGGGRYCILIGDTHPSAERQQALCFPGEDWVAEEVLCTGTLYANDYWRCDVYGKDRLHVDDLMQYYERHKIPWEKDPQAAPTAEPA
jgi:hypothetical protein